MAVKPRRVLFVVANDNYIEVARQAFESHNGNFVLDIAHGVREAKDRINSLEYGVVITDHKLPDGDALELLPGKDDVYQYPVIILTEKNDARFAVKAMKKGATDLVETSKENILRIPLVSKQAIEEWDARKIREEERVLTLYNKRLHSILKGIDEIYFEADLTGKITFFNDSACKKSGYSHAELKGKSYRDLAEVEAADRIFKLFHRVYQTGRPASALNFNFTTNKGVNMALDLFVYPVLNVMEKVSGFRCFARDVTRRNEYENKVKEAASHWELTFNSIPDGIMILDAGQKILRSNWAMAEIVSKDVRDMNGQQCWEIVHMTDGPIANCPFIKMKKTLKRESSELFMNGRWFEVTVDPMIDGSGSLTGCVHIVRDITDRKHIQTALKESEQRFRSIAESAPIAIMIYQDNKWVYVNPAAERISGYSADELLSMDFWDVVHPDYKEIVKSRGQGRQLGNSAQTSYEFKIISRDGNEKWVYLTGSTVEWKGKSAGIITVLDITSRKQMEQALKESEERYRNIVEDMADGYFETDIWAKTTFVNNSLCNILGCSMDDIMGKSGRTFLDEVDLNRIRQAFRKVYTTGETEKRFDCKIHRKDGTQRFIEASISLARDINGRKVGFRSVVRDVTDRRRMEELEHQLLHAQKLEAIGTLAGGIAHDFNNILTAILGNISLVKVYSDVGDNKVHERISEVEKAALKARKLIRRILSFSRQDIGKRKPISMPKLVDETLKILSATVPATIEIHKDIDYEAGMVEADPGLLEQVLMNLCTNALHAMDDKNGVLGIRLKKLFIGDDSPFLMHNLMPGSYVLLQVRDTGTGIPADIRDRIFDPYFTTKDVGEGSGLGLAMVHGIVRKYNGAVTVDSVPGKGSCFNVYLPLTDGTVDEPSHTDDDMTSLPRGKENIVLVDDEDIILKVGRDMLEKLGYKVKAFKNSNDALNVFRLEPGTIDLVITDMVMPLMDGRTLAKEIVKIRPDMPIILCTGYNDKISSGDAGKAGIKGFIMKPFMLRELALKVRKALDGS